MTDSTPHPLPEISDDTMRARLAGTRTYTLMILTRGPNYAMPGADRIIWEHGRHNFALREAGLLRIVCPVNDGTTLAGIGIFDAEVAEVERIYAADPAVQAGVLSLEVHPTRGFPRLVLAGLSDCGAVKRASV